MREKKKDRPRGSKFYKELGYHTTTIRYPNYLYQLIKKSADAKGDTAWKNPQEIVHRLYKSFKNQQNEI